MGSGNNSTNGILGFGVGYVAGMVMGDRPLRIARRAAAEARARATSAAATAVRVRARVESLAAIARPRSPIRRSNARVDVREVGEVMRPVAGSIGPKATLREAAVLMRRAGVSELVVAKSDRVRGVLTDRDIVVRAVARGLDPMARVSDVMTRSDVAISTTAPMQEALDVMRSHGISRLAVMESGRPVGVLSFEASGRAGAPAIYAAGIGPNG